MRKKLFIAATMAAALALTAAGAGYTWSYLTSQESFTNTFTVGDLEIGLNEPDWDPDEGDGKNIYPGYSVYKNPTVKNITSDKNGAEPCYVRMRILLTDHAGQKITDEERLKLIRAAIRYDSTYSGSFEKKGAGEQIVQGRIPGYTLEEMEKMPMINPLFTIDEERSSGGEIVCNYMARNKSGILNIGEQATLFTALAVPVEWKNAQIKLLGDFKIVVRAEAIQANGFASQQAAFEALDAEEAAAYGEGL